MKSKKEIPDLYTLPTFGEGTFKTETKSFDTKNDTSKNKKKNSTYYLSVDIIEQIDRMAYWDRMNKGEAIEKVLKEYFEKKSYEPIP
jgi:hypothetical protein